MQFNVRMMVTLGCVSLFATSLASMSAPAFAAPKKQDVSLSTRINRTLFGSANLVSEARKYMGTNPTDRTRLWCATFMNMVLAKSGYSGTNSDAAKSFAQYGHRISEPRVGAIAVLTRGKRGGHVGVVSGIDANGNPIIISGNHNKRVGESVYARSRVIAYVMPAENRNARTQLASGPVSKPLDLGIDSPISELIAAIEAESTPVRLPPGANAQARQVPERAAAPRRKIDLDPAIAEFLGIKPSAPAARVAPQVQPHVQQQSQPQRQAQPQQIKPTPVPQPAPQRQQRVAQVTR
jgi:uncharacterized protein (TIGR02594 family)